MKKLFALTIILGIIICAVSATSFSAERITGHKFESDDTITKVGDLPTEAPTEPTEATETVETRVVETIYRETPTTDETIGEEETTAESTEVPTEAETVEETTVETTTTQETETPATDDSVPPVDPKNPHRNAVATGDNGLLFIGIGMLAVALTLLIVTSRKRSRSAEK